MNKIKVIGFDADDTLWANAIFFKEAENKFIELMADIIPSTPLVEALYATEMKNMEWYGYGVMAFTLSMVETAIQVSNEKVPAYIIAEILALGQAILAKPIQLAPGVPEIFPLLRDQYRLVVVTKGDLLDQERKLKNSGLLPYFQHIEVVTEKHAANYRHLIDWMGIKPEEFLMIGNSLKSDIVPVLEIGGRAVHIPHEIEWLFETARLPKQEYFKLDSLLELPNFLSI